MFLRYRKYWFGFYLLPIFPEDNKNIFLDLFEAIFILIIFLKDYEALKIPQFKFHLNLNMMQQPS